MTDFFALLGQPRSPCLEPEAVKKAFVIAAAAVHPDRIHDAPDAAREAAHERYTRLNEAEQCLARTRTRLRHLLELERGGKVRDLQEMPEALMQLFQEVGAGLRAADQHCRESAAAESPLLKVALFAKGEELREVLQATQKLLNERLRALEEELQSVSERWAHAGTGSPSDREGLLQELETLYRLISFHDRWLSQVQSRILQLMEPAP